MGNKKDISGEGWRFKGRGLCQITGRTNHTNAYDHIKDHPAFKGLQMAIQEDADKIVALLDANAYLITAFSMAHWKNIVLNHLSNGEEDTNQISSLIGTDVAWKEKKKVFNTETSVLFETNTCTFTYFPDYGDGVLEIMKRYAEKGNKYKMDNNRTSLKYKDIVAVDCSEFVCIYLHLLGVTKQVAHIVTGGMITEEIFRNNLTSTFNENCTLDFVSGKNPDFEPCPGDIFVWSISSSKGHCGIVYKYDKEKKIVTVLEALTESADMSTHLNNKFPNLDKNEKNRIKELGMDNNHTRISYYLLKGKALQGHDGWVGYYRPRGYSKKLK